LNFPGRTEGKTCGKKRCLEEKVGGQSEAQLEGKKDEYLSCLGQGGKDCEERTWGGPKSRGGVVQVRVDKNAIDNTTHHVLKGVGGRKTTLEGGAAEKGKGGTN